MEKKARIRRMFSSSSIDSRGRADPESLCRLAELVPEIRGLLFPFPAGGAGASSESGDGVASPPTDAGLFGQLRAIADHPDGRFPARR
jgi:hypothetical protein